MSSGHTFLSSSLLQFLYAITDTVFEVAQEPSYADSMEGMAADVISCSSTLIRLVVNWLIPGWKIGLDFQA